MTNRKPYSRKSHRLTASILKGIGLVAAGGLTMVIVLTIAKAVSLKSDTALDGKVIGFRHEAAAIPSAGNASPVVAPTAREESQNQSADTVVRNGVTVVSPEVLVPSIDLAALEAANGSNDADSSKQISNSSKPANQSHPRRQARKRTAYGLAIR